MPPEVTPEELVDVVETADVARALIQMILAMVAPDTAQKILNEEVVKAVNMAADVAEAAKFGPKN